MLVGYHRNVSTASSGVPRRASDPRGTRRPDASRTRRVEFVSVVGELPPSRVSPRWVISPHAAAPSKMLPSVVRGLDRATMIGELSTRATVSTGSTSNHGFRRKYLTGSDLKCPVGS